MASNTLKISININAPRENVWSAIADWKSQGDWMLQTKVWVTSDSDEGVGTSIAAFTGPLYKFYPRIKSPGLLDLMRVTKWEPPHRCEVIHYGKILKGDGAFVLTSPSEKTTRFDWSETILAPTLLFWLSAPFLYIGVLISLRRFKRLCERASSE
ncbi:SRPBCC domain containing protein [Candidatus Nanopelagicaceae bacterium]